MCVCVRGWAGTCAGGVRFSNSNRIIPSDYRILHLLKMPIPNCYVCPCRVLNTISSKAQKDSFSGRESILLWNHIFWAVLCQLVMYYVDCSSFDLRRVYRCTNTWRQITSSASVSLQTPHFLPLRPPEQQNKPHEWPLIYYSGDVQDFCFSCLENTDEPVHLLGLSLLSHR